eukprot:m51a1_g14066 hypothetical protein (387) ;mRNA; r:1232678-1234254
MQSSPLTTAGVVPRLFSTARPFHTYMVRTCAVALYTACPACRVLDVATVQMPHNNQLVTCVVVGLTTKAQPPDPAVERVSVAHTNAKRELVVNNVGLGRIASTRTPTDAEWESIRVVVEHLIQPKPNAELFRTDIATCLKARLLEVENETPVPALSPILQKLHGTPGTAPPPLPAVGLSIYNPDKKQMIEKFLAESIKYAQLCTPWEEEEEEEDAESEEDAALRGRKRDATEAGLDKQGPADNYLHVLGEQATDEHVAQLPVKCLQDMTEDDVVSYIVTFHGRAGQILERCYTEFRGKTGKTPQILSGRALSEQLPGLADLDSRAIVDALTSTARGLSLIDLPECLFEIIGRSLYSLVTAQCKRAVTTTQNVTGLEERLKAVFTPS